MPRGDRTGPDGMGPMTGRAAGFCAGYGMPGFANPTFGRGRGFAFGRGRGAWGRGWRSGYYAAGLPGWTGFRGATPYSYPNAENEKRLLKAQADAMQGEIAAIRRRLEELEKEESPK